MNHRDRIGAELAKEIADFSKGKMLQLFLSSGTIVKFELYRVDRTRGLIHGAAYPTDARICLRASQVIGYVDSDKDKE